MRKVVVFSLLTAATLATGCQEPFNIFDYVPKDDGGMQGGPLDGGDGDGEGDGDGGPSNPLTDAGPLPGIWMNVTGNLAGIPSDECGNVGRIVAKPDEDKLIVGIAPTGLWASSDGAASWSPIGKGAGSANIVFRASSYVFDPENPQQYWASGIYNGGPGVVRTTDNGGTFTALGKITHNDTVAVDLSDPERKVILAGAHETKNVLWKSVDGGQNWVDIGASLPAKTCVNPLILDANTYLLGCTYESEGILRTTDGGSTWNEVSDLGGSDVPLRASDGSIYWATRGIAGLMRSTDDGLTWTQVVGPNVVRSTAPLELPDHQIVMLGNATVLASADQGAHWHAVSPALPYKDVTGLTYSTQQKAFFIKRHSCRTNPDPMDVSSKFVPNDAVMRFDYDAE
jgi:photosystem II stability/assembly factor-like uncharacterized protein